MIFQVPRVAVSVAIGSVFLMIHATPFSREKAVSRIVVELAGQGNRMSLSYERKSVGLYYSSYG